MEEYPDDNKIEKKRANDPKVEKVISIYKFSIFFVKVNYKFMLNFKA